MQKNIRDCLIFLAVFTLPLFSSCGSVKISGVDLDSVRKGFFSGNYEIAESADFAEVSKAGKKYSWLPYVFYLGLSDKNSRRAEFYLSEAMENSPYPLNVTAYSILIKRLDSPFWEKALEFGGKFNRQEYREYFPYTRPEYTEALKAYSGFKEGKFKSAEKLLNQNLYELKGFSGFYQEKDSEYVQEEFYILRDGVYLISLFNQYSSGLGEPGTDLSGLQRLCSDSGFLDNLRLFFLMYPADSQWYTLTLDAFSSFYEKVKEVYPSFFETAALKEISYIKEAAQCRQLSGSMTYGLASRSFENLVGNLPEEYSDVFFAFYGLASDCGKAFLYGGGGKVYNGELFNLYSGLPETYTTVFYMGRLSNAMGRTEMAAGYFEKAFSLANTDSQADYALLNLFEVLRKNLPEKLSGYITKFSGLWHDTSVFNSFWEEYITYLCENRNWDLICRLYLSYGESLHPDTEARLSYLTGKIISDSLTEGSLNQSVSGGKDLEESCFLNALNKDHNLFYYRIMALKELEKAGFAQETQIDSIIPVSMDFSMKTGFKDDLMDSVKTLLDWGFEGEAAKILQNYEFLPVDYVESLVDCFYNSGYWEKGLRVASRFMYTPDRKLTKEDYRYLYPQGFNDLIEEISGKFSLDKNLVFGLVRTESFFNPEVGSSAGAVGLTQLMLSTAKDTARKLKISDKVTGVEDLKNPRLNLILGCSYLSEMVSRLDGNVLNALFAYNGGITRVRRWRSEAEDLSDELFLEVVPFQETRDYGRKVLSAASFYEYLYR